MEKIKRITDQPITYQILEDMGFNYEGSIHDCPEFSKGDLYLVECFDEDLENVWMDEKTGVIFRTIEDLLTKQTNNKKIN